MTEKLIVCKLLETISSNMFHSFNFSKGQIIHFESEQCDHLEILTEGKLIVQRIDEDGNQLAIREFVPGDIIGGNLIFSRTPYYPMTITALTNVSLIRMAKETVFQLCTSNATFLRSYLEIISDYTLVLGDKIKTHVRRSLKSRILTYLHSEHLRQGSLTITLVTSKKALADYFGVERTSLSRALKQLKDEGYIAYDSSTITLLKQLDGE